MTVLLLMIKKGQSMKIHRNYIVKVVLLLTISIVWYAIAHAGQKKLADVFKRNQPVYTRLFKWDDKVIVEMKGHKFYEVDIKSSSLTPLATVQGSTPVSFTEAFNKPVMLATKNNAKLLLMKEGKKWKSIEAPSELNGDDKLLLLGHATGLVILSEKSIFRYEKGSWAKVKIIYDEKFSAYYEKGSSQNQNYTSVEIERSSASHLLKDDKVYLGVNHGEWGGGLYTLDIYTGMFDKVTLEDYLGATFGGNSPVQDIKLSNDNTLWVAYGLSHMGGRRGFIGMVQGTKCDPLIVSTNLAVIDNKFKKFNKNWSYEVTTFPSIAFNELGELFMLADSVGIVKLSNGKQHRITRDWNPWANIYPRDLIVVSDDIYLIGFSDAGIGVFNKEGEVLGRVRLE